MNSSANFLIIITHDTGRHLGCYSAGVKTPNLDRLASEGVQFRQCFCTAAQCSPSRASLLTGMVPHSHGLIGLTHRGFRLNADVKTLPALLAQAGYRTNLFGFQHESPDASSLGYQNAIRAERGGHSCLAVTPLVLDYLASKPEQPFFTMVGFSETHRKYPKSEGLLDDIKPLPYLPDEPEVRRDIADLNVAVRRVDDSIGEVLDALQRNGLAEDTLLIYTTDHGIAFPGAKATLFDPGLEIAMIARGPGGFTSGQRIDAMISNMDILPTLLELTDQPVPNGVQGKSLFPLVRGETDRLYEQLFPELTYHAAYDPMRGVRTDRYKYIRSYEERPFSFPPNVDGGLTKELLKNRGYFDRRRPPEMLYDLAVDPFEQRNVIGDPGYAGVLNDLRARLDRWMRDTNDPLLKGYVPPHPAARVTPADSFEPRLPE
jgi:N-sulfoglucosamine sulfohydrolase